MRDPGIKRALRDLYQGPWTPYAARQRAELRALPAERRAKGERALAAGDHLAAHLDTAPVILVFCFNPEVMTITDLNLPRPSVVGGASVYPAVQNALLACRAEGLGCVLTTLLCVCEAQLRPLLGIPEPWGTAVFVPLGYPLGRGHGPVARRAVEQMVFADPWGQAALASG